MDAAKPNPSPEEQFRSSLQDVIAVMRGLSPLCRSVDELVGMAELALQNDGQLLLLMERVAPIRMRK